MMLLVGRSARAFATGLAVLVVGLAQLPGPGPAAAAPVRKTILIGRSVDGRPIRAREIGDPSSPHKVLVVGCIHGNECAGLAVIHALRHGPSPTGLDVWTIGAVNPDGRAAGTRQNGRGVDLNRNFHYRWQPNGQPWDTYYSGPRPLSEPESRAARRFIKRLRPDVTIWYHQHMALVYRAGGDIRIERRYARLVGLPLKELSAPPGAATAWANHRWPNHTAFVVELPAGSLSSGAAERHASAVLKVGGM